MTWGAAESRSLAVSELDGDHCIASGCTSMRGRVKERAGCLAGDWARRYGSAAAGGAALSERRGCSAVRCGAVQAGQCELTRLRRVVDMERES